MGINGHVNGYGKRRRGGRRCRGLGGGDNDDAQKGRRCLCDATRRGGNGCCRCCCSFWGLLGPRGLHLPCSPAECESSLSPHSSALWQVWAFWGFPASVRGVCTLAVLIHLDSGCGSWGPAPFHGCPIAPLAMVLPWPGCSAFRSGYPAPGFDVILLARGHILRAGLI